MRLINAGAKVSGKDEAGFTALHVAARFDNVRAAEILSKKAPRSCQGIYWARPRSTTRSVGDDQATQTERSDRAMTKVLLVRLALSLTLLVSITAGCRSETVDVKYRGPVDLSPFACSAIERSSFIHRVCYDHANAYMIVKLNGHLLSLLRH